MSENVGEGEQSLLARHPLCRVKDAFGKALTTTCGVPQDYGVRLGIESEFVCSGNVPGANARYRYLPIGEFRLDLPFQLQGGGGRSILFEAMMRLADVRFVNWEVSKQL